MVGRDIPMVAREARTIHRQLTGPSLWTLIADKESSTLAHFSHSDSVAGCLRELAIPS